MTLNIPDELPILGEGNEDFVYVNTEEFVAFWSERYEESQENFEPLYANRINKDKFDKDDIQKFYEWFGLRITNRKSQPTITAVTDRLDVVNDLKSDFKKSKFKIENFNSNFPTGRPLKIRSKLLLLHIIAPTEYPPFAVPAYRAYQIIMQEELRNFPGETVAEEFYYKTYITFFKRVFDRISYDRKKLDEALWMLGKEYIRLIKDR